MIEYYPFSPEFPMPELLTHPNIPKPLHGINPRTIMGQSWWDKTRKEAYAKYNQHCWACGIHKSKAKYRRWLEAHEGYNIDYKTGTVTINEIVALCNACHNFIHSGRLYALTEKGETPINKSLSILKRGLDILEPLLLKPFAGTIRAYGELKGFSDKAIIELADYYGVDMLNVEDEFTHVAWKDWKLIFNGKEYYSKFEHIEEWAAHYAR